MDDQLDEQDESVRIAVRALDDMRNNAQLSRTDALLSTASAPDSNSPFVSRMSHLPLVNSALRAYEHGKASSRVVKYGAEMMESSVKTISRPVIDRLPVNVNQLDEFACRQLDRFDRYRRPSSGENTTPTSPRPSDTTPQIIRGSTTTNDPSPSTPMPDSPDMDRPRVKLKTKTLDGSPSWIEANSPFVGPAPTPPDITPTSRSSTPTRNHETQVSEPGAERQVAHRSRWQAVLLEAGGLSAALSEESMRRLKYCLQWLQYATAHIDAQILILRDFTASLQPLPAHRQTQARPHSISQAHLRTLTTVRRDIVHTIRQVVDVVSRYAGGALPEPARGRVRGFILELPQRWARKAGTGAEDIDRDRDRDRESVAAASGSAVRRGNRRAAGRERGTGSSASAAGTSAASSRAGSPITRHPRLQEEGSEQPVSAGTAILAAQRILTLATESLDMMRGVTGVVKDSLDRADAWVGRLRTVGIQRGGGPETEEDAQAPPSTSRRDRIPGELDFTNVRGHERTRSAGSQFDATELPSPYSGASSAYSSYGGSIPSTPGGGTYTPAYGFAGGYAGNAPSPGAMGLGLSAMSLGGSRYSTPRSVAGGLPDEDEDEDEEVTEQESGGGDKGVRKERVGEGVRIVGMDVEGDEDGARREGGLGKMDVDA